MKIMILECKDPIRIKMLRHVGPFASSVVLENKTDEHRFKLHEFAHPSSVHISL